MSQQFSDRETLIVCRNSQGAEVRAMPLRLNRYSAVFEVYNPYSILQLSEVLGDFQIIMNQRVVYSGRAVVSNLVNTGIVLVCEATLDESWLETELFSSWNQKGRLQNEAAEFIQEWQKIYKVTPEFKTTVADIQTLLMDLRRWLESIELGIRSEPDGDRLQMEREVIEQLRGPMLPSINTLFERFETTCGQVSEDLQPIHRSYVKKQLHPLVLCSPFVYRTYQKPLGYAGDYEMVNMILREPYEGSTLFAKLLNVWILTQAPAEAHRNRIVFLTQKLIDETKRVSRLGKTLKVLNLGCGPAVDVEKFLIQSDLCERARFTLLDFNDETLSYCGKRLDEVKMKHRRATPLLLKKKSVHQILKEASKEKADSDGERYDFVYCAGLFDYLSDRVCKRLMNHFYEDLLSPGGLLIATNVDSSNPIRHIMEYLLEWNIFHRNLSQLKSLHPEEAPIENIGVTSDSTGVNIYVEARKPSHA